MSNFIFPHPSPPSLAILNTQKRDPVRKIYCVGRNYAEHIREMGGTPQSATPVIFTKSHHNLVETGCNIPYPPNTKEVHYEVELVVAMGPDGIFGYATGIDLTRRDLQAQAKSKGGPWARAKDFPCSAPCSALTLAEDVSLHSAQITLRKNAEIMQQSCLSHMIWSVDEIIAHLQNDMDLQSGDLIYTGTPAGVGSVMRGDQLIGEITGLEAIKINMV